MNSTSLELQIHSVRAGLISDEDNVIINYAFGYIMLIVSLVGVVTNSINIRTFIAMGLEDGITVSLMGLAISDLGFTFFGCILSSSNIIAAIEVMHDLKGLPIHPKLVFGMFSANIGFMFYQVTCLNTTFIAVARCMCVAMPFKFKDFFTKSRSIFALIVFNAIAAASYLPVLSLMGVQTKLDPTVNKSRVVLWVSPKRSDINNAVNFIHLFFFIIVSSLVVGVCVVIMAKHLRQSVKFRHNMSSAKGSDKVDGKDNSGSKLSGKEFQVVKQVIIICILYNLSTLPNIFAVIYGLIEEEFGVGKRYHNFHFTVGLIIFILGLVNSATTFPIYYFYNSKFRSLCFSLSSKPKKGKIGNTG